MAALTTPGYITIHILFFPLSMPEAHPFDVEL